MTRDFIMGAVAGCGLGILFVPIFTLASHWGFHLLGPLEERELVAAPGHIHRRLALFLVIPVAVSSLAALALVSAALALLPAGAARQAFSLWFAVGLFVGGFLIAALRFRGGHRDNPA